MTSHKLTGGGILKPYDGGCGGGIGSPIRPDSSPPTPPTSSSSGNPPAGPGVGVIPALRQRSISTAFHLAYFFLYSIYVLKKRVIIIC